jgi:hypothetical protein
MSSSMSLAFNQTIEPTQRYHEEVENRSFVLKLSQEGVRVVAPHVYLPHRKGSLRETWDAPVLVSSRHAGKAQHKSHQNSVFVLSSIDYLLPSLTSCVFAKFPRRLAARSDSCVYRAVQVHSLHVSRGQLTQRKGTRQRATHRASLRTNIPLNAAACRRGEVICGGGEVV